jgi:hypothetical protein
MSLEYRIFNELIFNILGAGIIQKFILERAQLKRRVEEIEMAPGGEKASELEEEFNSKT